MKPTAMGWVVLIVGAALTGRAATLTPDEKTLAVINAGAVEPAVMADVFAYLEQELNVGLRLADVPASERVEPSMVAGECIKQLKATDVGVLVLARLPLGAGSVVAAPDDRWVVLNVTPLLPKDGANDLLTARLKKQVLRAVALLTGVGFTLDVRAVNRSLLSIDELDQFGSNYDPPSQERFNQLADALGLIRHFRRPDRWYRLRNLPIPGADEGLLPVSVATNVPDETPPPVPAEPAPPPAPAAP